MAESSREYIERVIEPKNRRPTGKIDENDFFHYFYLLEPLGKVSYNASGSVEIEKDGISLFMNYRSLDSAVDKTLINTIKASMDFPTLYRKLTGFTLRDNEGHQLTLTDLVPGDSSLVFNPSVEPYDSEGHANLNKTIRIRGDLVVPQVILTALHEAGHMQRIVNKDKATILKNQRKYIKVTSHKAVPSYEDLEFHLREERDAWASVERKILPFCRGSNKVFTRDGVIDFIHERLEFTRNRIESSVKRNSIDLKLIDQNDEVND